MNVEPPSNGKLTRTEGAIFAGIALLFVALSIGYSLVVPAFEKPDELYHYAFARHLAQGNGLPVQTLGNLGPWEHEGTQAPLYYFLVGRLTAGIDQNDFDQLNRQNPRANLGNPLYPGNKNLMLYGAQARPLARANLALHVGRWLSVAFGVFTLLFVYLTARLAFPHSAAARLFATLIVAAIPQFAFISSALSNDSLVVLVSAATIYWLARLLSKAHADPIFWWEWGVVGVLLGFAALSKLHGLVLLAPIGVTVLWIAWQRRSWRLVFGAGLLIAAPALILAGWWYWRNLQLYGDLLGAERLLTINGMRREPLTWGSFVGEMRGLRYSFWGLFGWFNILLPTWVYRLLDAVTVLAVAGFVARAARAFVARKGAVLALPEARTQALPAFWAVTLIVSMIYWATFATSSQGRLLFPALSALGVILVAGLLMWLDFVPRWRWLLLALLPVGLVGSSLYALLALLPAHYAAPQPVAALPDNAHPINITYGDGIELVGAILPTERYKPGEDVPITLYLRSSEKQTQDHQLFVQLLDENREAIGNVTTHPGWGRNPTSLWQPGALYEDRYVVRIEELIGESSPLRADIYIGFTQPDSTEPEAATDAQAQPSNAMVGEVVIEPHAQIDLARLGLRPIDVTFDRGIRLAGVSLPDAIRADETSLRVQLLYEAGGAPDGDYTAFLHLLDAQGEQVTGYDQPPGLNRFPTRLWQASDRILSEFAVTLPQNLAPGTYEVWTGLYRTESQGQERLAVIDGGLPAQDMRVLLGSVRVE